MTSSSTLRGSVFNENEPNQATEHSSKGYFLTFLIGIFVFIPLYGTDIVLCLYNQLPIEALGISILLLLNASQAVAMYMQKKYYHLIPLNCFINYTIVSSMIVLEGYTTGSYFYYLPIAMVYILYATDIRHKIKPATFVVSISLFAAAILLSFRYAGNTRLLPVPNAVFVYRLIETLVLSAVVLRYFLPTLINKKNLKVRKNYFEALFQSSIDAFIVFNKETREIIDYNKTTYLLFELPVEAKVKGLYISQFMMRYLAGNSQNLEVLMDSLPGDWQGEGKFITYNKKEFTAFVNSTHCMQNDTECQILCIRDITKVMIQQNEILNYKESLENSTKVKTRFLSSISHELRTPLNGIIGTSNLLLDDPGLSANAREQLKLQLYSSEHMLSIINDILDFSKIDSGKTELNMQPFNLLDVIQHLVHSFEKQFERNKIQFQFSYPPELENVRVISDEIKLKQILSNLISNALKFTLEGSVHLLISAEQSDDKYTKIQFRIQDTGIGISQDKHAEIFKGFSQVHADDLKRRFGGTGLGLTISQKLVQLFGSSIQVESELGKGACFYFSINFKKEQAVAIKIPLVESTFTPAIDIRGVRILVVEDNEINAVVLKTFLSKWEIRIMEAANGIQALELLKYHKFDLIFMDLEMPEMNGYAATEIIRQTNTEVPVIAFTATLLENMEELITKNGFTDYILKPFKPKDLKLKIERFAPHRKIEYA